MNESYCCPMRARFILGIVAENPSVPVPVDAADHIDFEAQLDGVQIIRIKYCPWCAGRVSGNFRVGI